ncbi:TPA: hypothetical protein ACH3X2_011875 [Trebouxia sp. C0005]
MVVADLVKRVLQADELHDPTWIGHPQEQPEHMKTIIRFQDKVLAALEDLIEDLQRSNENKWNYSSKPVPEILVSDG